MELICQTAGCPQQGTAITVPDTLPPDMDVYCAGCGNAIPKGAPPEPEPEPPVVEHHEAGA